jgi:acetamidase/formamidase
MAVHEFRPTHYYITIGSHEPVLHVAPGDTIVTTTVDSGGRDERSQQVTRGGNPQTGPFYVDGAEPGDTLVVHLDELAPNRPEGYTSTRLAPNVVDPDAVLELPQRGTAMWKVDREGGRASLQDGDLAGLTLPLAPMLGCFGVAPANGEAISTATSAEHGGNMDYRGFTTGVTVYFPVLVPGALLFVGDGHALQGDGEISGTGIEISFDVRFTVDVQKGRKIGWPRGENDRYIFTAGNARPLDQAMQHATTEMSRWLGDEYGLDGESIGVLMGQCVEYDVGNVFDPAYTMICKMSKELLQGLPRRETS